MKEANRSVVVRNVTHLYDHCPTYFVDEDGCLIISGVTSGHRLVRRKRGRIPIAGCAVIDNIVLAVVLPEANIDGAVSTYETHVVGVEIARILASRDETVITALASTVHDGVRRDHQTVAFGGQAGAFRVSEIDSSTGSVGNNVEFAWHFGFSFKGRFCWAVNIPKEADCQC